MKECDERKSHISCELYVIYIYLLILVVVVNSCSEHTVYRHWLIISTVSFYRYLPVLFVYSLFFLLTFSSVYPLFALEL